MSSAEAKQQADAVKREISKQVDLLDSHYTEAGQQKLDRMLMSHTHWHAVWRDLLSQGK